MVIKRWQDWVNVVLGLWMLASPWALDFAADNSAPARSAWLLGAAIVIFAALAVYIPRAWEEAINVILGLALVVSPWALGFLEQTTPTTNAVIVGLLVIAFGVWAMLMNTDVRKWWHEHHGTGTR